MDISVSLFQIVVGLAVYLVIAAVLIAVSVIDFRTRRIPNEYVLALLALRLVVGVLDALWGSAFAAFVSLATSGVVSIGVTFALVVLTMIKERSGYERDGSFSTPLATHWQSFDAGIAAQTFCLSAHALGLGTVIMGIYDPAEVAKVVEIPEGQEVAALIALGHPAQDPQAPARKDVDTLLRFE